MPRKLIEVALPLEAINAAAVAEKKLRQSHPATIHLWWARRPMATARAVLFAQLVDDPSTWPELAGDEAAQQRERDRLFRLIERVVPWESCHDDALLAEVRCEIARSHARFHPEAKGAARIMAADVTPAEVNAYLATALPPVHDPFAGGGTIPLEAQRLGLRAVATDLNPVAVLINKALIEIPPKFAGQPPMNPESQRTAMLRTWRGVEGLAEDVRHYGNWVRDEAYKRVGHLYPKVQLPKEHGGGEATVIAWLWARTVKCSNPSCGATMPLARSFVLSTKKGKERHVAPVIDRKTRSVRFEVRQGPVSSEMSRTVDRKGARCVVCSESVPLEHVRAEGKAGRLGTQMMAVVVEGKRERIYLSPSADDERLSASSKPEWKPGFEFPKNSRHLTPWVYGMTTWSSLFSSRQAHTLTTIAEVISRSAEASATKSIDSHHVRAIQTYLAILLGNLADLNNALCTWKIDRECAVHLFTRQAVPMAWDFVEANPFSDSAGSLNSSLANLCNRMERFGRSPLASPLVEQADASQGLRQGEIFCTDPPYYDNVPYADLSDFFYVWLKRCLADVYPDLFRTMLVPKQEELVADPFRHGSAEAARAFFETGLFNVFRAMAKVGASDHPLTVYYAFKQSEGDDEGDEEESTTASSASTGWETMLAGLIEAGWSIGGTWPMRTELGNRMRNIGSNALASSIVLVCRKRPATATSATRAEFLRALKRKLPGDLKLLQQGNIAPVDFAQAAIGPGMAVFSSFAKVLESDGSVMPVRAALQHINAVLDEVLSEQEGDFDADTRCALAWFEQHQYEEAEFGSADTLARAKNTSVAGLVEAGVLRSARGKVRLLKRDELDPAWDPATDARRTVWEVAQHLIRVLGAKGEVAAAGLLARVGAQGDAARELAYRLYSLCERKKWAAEALAYNGLVTAWPELTRLAAEAAGADGAAPTEAKRQGELFE